MGEVPQQGTPKHEQICWGALWHSQKDTAQRRPGKLWTLPGLQSWTFPSKIEASILPSRYPSRSQFLKVFIKSFSEHCWVVKAGEIYASRIFTLLVVGWASPAVSEGRRRRHSLREEDEGKKEEEEEEEKKKEKKMMEEIFPLILCGHLFSLLQRTLSKREDQSSDHTSTVQWFGNSPGKKRFQCAACFSICQLCVLY